jgi:hypothetical protein
MMYDDLTMEEIANRRLVERLAFISEYIHRAYPQPYYQALAAWDAHVAATTVSCENPDHNH